MIIDSVIIGFCLLFLIWGAIKGIKKQIFKILAVVAIICISAFAAKPVAGLLAKTPLGDTINTAMEKTIDSKNIGEIKISDAIVVKNGDTFFVDTNGVDNIGGLVNIDETFKTLKLPKFMHKDITAKLEAGKTLGACVVPIFSLYILTIISAVGLSLIATIVLVIIYIFVKKGVKKSRTLTAVDRSLGAVFNFCIAILIVFGVFALFNATKNFTFMAPLYAEIDKSFVSKFLLEKNLFVKLIESIFSIVTIK